MRNYVQVIGVIVYDTATLQPVTGAFVGTKTDADSLKSDLENIFTPPNFEVREINYWVELNKNIMAQILTTGVPNGVLNFAFLKTEPPKKTWNSKNPSFVTSRRVDGKEPAIPKTLGKAGELDFSGAQGLLDALSALPELAAQLIKQGKIREANLVTYAYQQVLHGNWTITHAFSYLVDNGVVTATSV